MSKLTEYFKDTKAELKHVNWPSRRQILSSTVVIIILSVIVGYYLGVFDFIFSKLLGQVISI